MNYLRVGYTMNRGISLVREEDARQLTHLYLAFGRIRDGVLDLYMLPDLPKIEQFRKWNPELKLVLSIGGWEGDGFSPMAMTEEGRRTFARSCLETVERYNLDGIDIDWEYPCSSVAGIASDPRDKENFTLLLQALRDTLGENRILSAAVGAAQSCIRNTEMDKVAKILDFVGLMTYDLAGEFPGKAGHHAGLAISKKVVEWYHDAGVPYEKMLMGMAFYGRHFEVQGTENHGLGQPAGEGLPGPAFAMITPEYIRENGYEQFWDEEGEAAYLFNGTTFVSYESPEAIRRKCVYAMEKGMKGVMYWQHEDDPTGTLLGVIAENLD